MSYFFQRERDCDCCPIPGPPGRIGPPGPAGPGAVVSTITGTPPEGTLTLSSVVWDTASLLPSPNPNVTAGVNALTFAPGIYRVQGRVAYTGTLAGVLVVSVLYRGITIETITIAVGDPLEAEFIAPLYVDDPTEQFSVVVAGTILLGTAQPSRFVIERIADNLAP